ncbi:pilus assembly protein MshP [Stutzerimonas nitrititolerans]|uniref:pilus assembly protein MshP n=1 Tax=Stutzerimonas nitrititolerans TaxID=2482751 RepID=UPI0028A9E1BB|nr:pilus assembly protein MshP [Stutzerimonas nitrititolerans]
MFLIIVITSVIAAIWRMSSTQAATNNLSLQQARAYQAAQAGIEWGISRALEEECSEEKRSFTLDGFSGLFQVDVSCSETDSSDLPEEGIQNIVFYTITSEAEYASVGSLDHAYRQLQAVIEHATVEAGSGAGED